MNPIERLTALHDEMRAGKGSVSDMLPIIEELKQRDEAVRCIALDLEFMGGLDGTTSTESLTIAARLRAALEGKP